VRDIGGIVWLIFIVIGVISSIVQSARKNAARSGSASRPGPVVQQARPTAQPAPAAQQQMSPQVVRLMAQFAAAAQAVAPPQPQPPPPPPPKPAPLPPPVETAQEAAKAFQLPLRPVQRPLQWMFEDKRAFVRAVIASEVLGKPRALRDE